MLEVKKNINESSANLLRRFRNKVKQASLISEVKSKRFHRRKISAAIKKKGVLKKIERRQKQENLRRWGKR